MGVPFKESPAEVEVICRADKAKRSYQLCYSDLLLKRLVSEELRPLNTACPKLAMFRGLTISAAYFTYLPKSNVQYFLR